MAIAQHLSCVSLMHISVRGQCLLSLGVLFILASFAEMLGDGYALAFEQLRWVLPAQPEINLVSGWRD